MADPLAVIASITGLIMAGVQITTTVSQFISKTADAPTLAQVVSTEVRECVVILKNLQPVVLGPLRSATVSMIAVDDLVVTLTGCVCTLSELEKEIDSLTINDNMPIQMRLKWAWAESTLRVLIERIQHHKSSLSLMLHILTCIIFYVYEWASSMRTFELEDGAGCIVPPSRSEASTETNKSVESLQLLVQQMSNLLAKMALDLDRQAQLLATPHLNSVHSSAASVASFQVRTTRLRSVASHHSFSTVDTQRASANSAHVVGSGDSIRSLSSLNFESTLLKTRIYTRALSRSCQTSPADGRWSVMSGASLEDISNISVLELPFHLHEVSNMWWYDGSITQKYFEASLRVQINSMESNTLASPADPLQAVRQCHTIKPINTVIQELDSSEIKVPTPATIPSNRDLSYPRYGESSLVYAVLRNDTQAVESLLTGGADSNNVSRYGYSVLSYASKTNNIAIAKPPLKHHAEVDTCGGFSYTPLQWAARERHGGILNLLLTHGADASQCCNGRSSSGEISKPIWLAAVRKHYIAVSTILRLAQKSTLMTRCQICQLTIFDHRLSISNNQVGQFIVETGIMVGGPWEIAAGLLYAETGTADMDLTLQLMDMIPPALFEQPNDQLLQTCVRSGRVELVDKLCAAGARCDVLDARGYTVLHIASLTNDSATMRCLLRYTLNLSVQDRNGLTPLELATSIRHHNAGLVLWEAENTRDPVTHQPSVVHASALKMPA